MSKFLLELLRKLYPRGTWGREDLTNPKQLHLFAQTYIHLLLGCTLPLIALPIVAWWPLCGLSIAFLIALITPLYREFHNDKHPISDIYNNTPAGIDCRSDILSCYVGSIIALIHIGVLTCLISFI